MVSSAWRIAAQATGNKERAGPLENTAAKCSHHPHMLLQQPERESEKKTGKL
jgi:hypothetical protein